MQFGVSGASVFYIRSSLSHDRFLKLATGSDAEQLRQEIMRTAWLGSHGVNVPPILRTLFQPNLVAMLMGALPGSPIESCDVPPDAVVEALARGFANLHSLPVESCPFDESIEVRLKRAEAAISDGQIDPAEFDDRNSEMTPKGLFERLSAIAPHTEDIVVVHGDATLTNILIDTQRRIGFVDCGYSGRADRYVDLALVASELAGHYGTDWIKVFFRLYGQSKWDSCKAQFFLDLYEFF